MKLKKLIMLLLLTALIFYVGFFTGSLEQHGHVREITLEQYRGMKAGGSQFILLVGRPSCRYCAIISSAVLTMDCDALPIYYLSLEQYINTEEYDTIKVELDVTYLPAMKYIEDCTIRYNLNNPLDSGYFECDGPDRLILYEQMVDKVIAFIDGAAGSGPVIHEIPISEEDHITAVPLPEERQDSHD